jgi:hypothetical protein
VSLPIVGRDADGEPVTFSASGLPAGLSINPASGVISGTVAPGTATGSPYTVTVAATDGSFSSSEQFSWTITPQVAVVATSGQTNVEGDTVSVQVQATDAGSLPFTYSATGLPAGLSIDPATGVISGTVSTGDSQAGPYLVVVTVTDGTYTSSETINWIVTHIDTVPPVLLNPGLQSNTEGDQVALPIVAADADGDPLVYSASELPNGLAIDSVSGEIVGTINIAVAFQSPYVVTVSADDGNGQTATQTFL